MSDNAIKLMASIHSGSTLICISTQRLNGKLSKHAEMACVLIIKRWMTVLIFNACLVFELLYPD